MNKVLTVLLFSFVLQGTVNAQQGVNWLKCMGGSAEDLYSKSVITRNGTLLCIGNTESTDGDAIGNHGTVDVLLSALSPNGTVLWKKLIGGTDWEGVNAVDIDTLTDGNFIIGFSSASNNGDISGNHGSTDFVFRKYSPAGVLIWSKTIGGSNEENLDQLRATPDGGIIAIGATNSNNNGDVGVSHGTNNYDMWMVKLDASGNIQWQKCLGGSQDETEGSVFPAADGSYYFTSTTKSSDGDLSGLVPPGTQTGLSEIWFGKVNSIGAISWLKQIGGSGPEDFPLICQKNQALYLAFYSNSADRDIPVNNSGSDAALFKLNNSGDIIWKQIYGGLAFDRPSAISFHPNGTLYFLVNTWSNISFSGFSFSNPGDNQLGLLKVDPQTGTPGSFRNFGGSLRDFSGDLEISADGGVFITGTTYSTDLGINGNHGAADGLVLKIAQGNLIQGTVFSDKNNNNIYDPGIDQPVSYIPVETRKQGEIQGVSVSNDGFYSIEVDTGTFFTKPRIYHSSYFTAVPDSFQCTFTNTPQFFTKDIQLRAVPGIRDLSVYTAPITPVRPAFQSLYLLMGQNLGTDTVSAGIITWKKDPRVSISNFSLVPNTIIGDSMIWNFTNLRPLDSIRIFIRVNTAPPPQLNANDTLKFSARIFPTAGDAYLADNTLLLNNIVTGPYDPNEKVNLQGDRITSAEIQSDSYLNYIIHFQNVGNAPAFDVIIHDTISSNLKLSTLQSLASSHPFKVEIKGNIIKWRFININLPDSFSNEPGSHGFIAFRIKPAANLIPGDSIINKAGIYFDYNDAVVTNPNIIRVVTANIVTAVSGLIADDKSVVVFPNPLRGNILHLVNHNPLIHFKTWKLISISGHTIVSGVFGSSIQQSTLQLPYKISNGIYVLELSNEHKKSYKKLWISR